MRTVKKRIIIVQDVNEFIGRKKTLLSRKDFDLLTVTSGHEALFRGRNDNPDLLILNFYMPDLNGYNVCRELKSDSSTEHIPILIIAAHGDEDEDPGDLTKAAGCDGCIKKPIQYDDIIPAVEELLGIPPRRHLRAGTSLPCKITDEDGLRDCTILNMTPEGVFVETKPAPWPGDIVQVELPLDATGTPMTLQMAVRWSRDSSEAGPPGAGCEFLGAPPEVVQWFKDHHASSPEGSKEQGS